MVQLKDYKITQSKCKYFFSILHLFDFIHKHPSKIKTYLFNILNY